MEISAALGIFGIIVGIIQSNDAEFPSTWGRAWFKLKSRMAWWGASGPFGRARVAGLHQQNWAKPEGVAREEPC